MESTLNLCDYNNRTDKAEHRKPQKNSHMDQFGKMKKNELYHRSTLALNSQKK